MDPTSIERWELLVKEYPKIADHISNSILKMFELSTLDEKTTQLVYIAVMACLDYPPAMRYHVPMAIDAGLGELGCHGILITRNFGRRVRISKVFTDLPLMPDKSVEFGVREMCEFCRKCAKACP